MKQITTHNAYDSPYYLNTKIYTYIKDNMGTWIETSIEIRANKINLYIIKILIR
jgi:hypothetical protein